MHFGKHSDYMALGYSAMALLMSGIIGTLYWRFRRLLREEAQIERLEAEDKK